MILAISHQPLAFSNKSLDLCRVRFTHRTSVTGNCVTRWPKQRTLRVRPPTPALTHQG